MPPYAKADIPLIVLTLLIALPLFILVLNKASGLNMFASSGTTLPSLPKILLGNETLRVTPYSHIEGHSVHLVWTASTETGGIAGYRIYRNGVKTGETKETHFDDNGVTGKITYTIEAYDPAGNTAKTVVSVSAPEK